MKSLSESVLPPVITEKSTEALFGVTIAQSPVKSQDRRWFDDDGRARSAPRTKKGSEKTEKEPVKIREIGCPQPGSVDDEKLLLQEKIFGDESLCAARREQFGNCDTE